MASIINIREPKKIPGLSIPLFERLVDFEPERIAEQPVHRFYTLEDLNQSIERELYHILGTQSKARKEDYLELSKDPLNYALPEMFGVPEFTYFEASNKENWKSLAKHMAKIIEIYEPRLKNVQVTINDFNKQSQYLSVSVTGILNVPDFQEEATFALELKGV